MTVTREEFDRVYRALRTPNFGKIAEVIHATENPDGGDPTFAQCWKRHCDEREAVAAKAEADRLAAEEEARHQLAVEEARERLLMEADLQADGEAALAASRDDEPQPPANEAHSVSPAP